jgi:AraC-like DNA-binding protein/mannose-6-phosphate isomerase-like protein (cupin superfamily)
MPDNPGAYRKSPGDFVPHIAFSKGVSEGIEGFEILSFDQLFKRKKLPSDHDPFTLHRLSFFAILIITEGQVNHQVDFESCVLGAGDTLVISAGQIHAFDKNAEYHGFLILFTEEFLYRNSASDSITFVQQTYEYFLGIRKCHCPEQNVAFIESLTRETAQESDSVRSLITGAALSMYLLQLGLGARSYALFQQFRQILKKKHNLTRDAADYASELGITYKHLNTICKSTVRQTAKTCIDWYVILEARRMLVVTSLSVKEICFKLGFDEPGNFQKYFKKHTRVTPAEFRKKFR